MTMFTFEEFLKKLKKLGFDEDGELKATTIIYAVLFVVVLTLVGMIVTDELQTATENMENIDLISSAAGVI